jgi:hypothetical protein
MPSTSAASLLVGTVLTMCNAEVSQTQESQAAVRAEPSGPGDSSLADPVKSWNEEALTAVRLARSSDAHTARLVAMVNVAMYDAVNGIEARCGRDDRRFALVASDDSVSSQASPAAAAAAAAHAVLAAQFPDRAGHLDAVLAADLARLGSGKSIRAGRAHGASVGAQVVRVRQDDGSAGNELQEPVQGVGRFPLAWAGVQFRNLRPFAIASSADYVSAGPPSMGSLDYAAAFAEVKLLGNAAIPDTEKLSIFQYWSLAAGTVQPPGEWVKIALTVSGQRELDLPEKTRLFALLGMALADAVAPTVTAKFTYAHWRPATAIAQAAEDGNPHTDADPTWRPRAGSAGGNPEHTSGHSAFSAAAATIIAGFFCNDVIPFTHVSDSSVGGAARSYPSLSDAAAEAGRSRVFGGIHFEFSNQMGIAAGRRIANEVLSKTLLRKKGRKHQGHCPL